MESNKTIRAHARKQYDLETNYNQDLAYEKGKASMESNKNSYFFKEVINGNNELNVKMETRIMSIFRLKCNPSKVEKQMHVLHSGVVDS